MKQCVCIQLPKRWAVHLQSGRADGTSVRPQERPLNSSSLTACTCGVYGSINNFPEVCPSVSREKQNFPGGAVVKNQPARAGDTSLIPGPGRSHMLQDNKLHVPQLLSLSSRAWEPQLLKPTCLKPVLCGKEATTVRSRRTTTRK